MATLQLLLAAGGVEHKQPQQPRWMVALFKTNAPEEEIHKIRCMLVGRSAWVWVSEVCVCVCFFSRLSRISANLRPFPT